MRRGDLVVVAMQGDHGKPRPALVIQSDLFDQLATVTVLPLISSGLVAAIYGWTSRRPKRTDCASRHRSSCIGRQPFDATRSTA